MKKRQSRKVAMSRAVNEEAQGFVAGARRGVAVREYGYLKGLQGAFGAQEVCFADEAAALRAAVKRIREYYAPE